MADISQNILDGVPMLVPFTSNYSQRLHASQVARLLHFPQKTVARKLELLRQSLLLDYAWEGKNKYYFLRRETAFPLLQIVESYKEVQFMRRHRSLGMLLGELSMDASVILFGSHAKGMAKESSDVDVVILSKKSREIRQIIAKYPFEVQAHFISMLVLEKRLKEHQPLVKEIVQHHILFGEKEKVIKALLRYSGW